MTIADASRQRDFELNRRARKGGAADPALWSYGRRQLGPVTFTRRCGQYWCGPADFELPRHTSPVAALFSEAARQALYSQGVLTVTAAPLCATMRDD